MASASVEAGSGLAAQIQSAVQPKLMENGWVVEENDTTLSEYVTMMVVNGKDLQGVMSELGGDLLGVGEDDAAVGEFARWLFQYAQSLQAPQQQQAQPQQQQQGAQPVQTVQDAQMEDSANGGDAPYVKTRSYPQYYSHGFATPAQQFFYVQQWRQQHFYNNQLTYSAYRPTGPKSMRNGNANGPRGGRGGRMLGQMNRNMDRSELPDNLRKIRGAAGIQAGRINSHADRAPRGPRGNSNVASGIQRAMNGGRGAHNTNNMNGGGGMMANGQMNPQQQMQLMQMMEMQANILAQAMQANGGQMPFMNNSGRGGFQQRGGRGGRGNAQSRGGGHHPAPAAKVLHAENGKMPLGALGSSKPAVASNGDSMDLDDGGANRPQPKFSTMCRFNQSCSNPSCDFAHQNPTSTTPVNVDMNETCTFGASCKNFKCTARHPSPAQSHSTSQGLQVDCKFWPHCTNAACPFRHGSAAPCRNGPDCKVEGCTFAHSKIQCRFNPCTNSRCTFKHEPGQKAGAGKKFEDKVWSKGAFETEEGKEELILPGQQQDGAAGGGFEQVKEEKMDGAGQTQAQEDVVT